MVLLGRFQFCNANFIRLVLARLLSLQSSLSMHRCNSFVFHSFLCVCVSLFQSRAGETTWKPWATCSCTSCVAVYPGRASRWGDGQTAPIHFICPATLSPLELLQNLTVSLENWGWKELHFEKPLKCGWKAFGSQQVFFFTLIHER